MFSCWSRDDIHDTVNFPDLTDQSRKHCVGHTWRLFIVRSSCASLVVHYVRGLLKHIRYHAHAHPRALVHSLVFEGTVAAAPKVMIRARFFSPKSPRSSPSSVAVSRRRNDCTWPMRKDDVRGPRESRRSDRSASRRELSNTRNARQATIPAAAYFFIVSFIIEVVSLVIIKNTVHCIYLFEYKAWIIFN